MHDLRHWRNMINEIMHDDEEHRFTSWGWWIIPDGAIVDIDEEGFHGVIANTWLRQHDTAYDEDDYDQSIADLVDAGGIRVATYHGTDHMNIDFAPGKVTPRALISMRKLMRETRAMFAGYFFGTTDDGPFGYAETMRRLVR